MGVKGSEYKLYMYRIVKKFELFYSGFIYKKTQPQVKEELLKSAFPIIIGFTTKPVISTAANGMKIARLNGFLLIPWIDIENVPCMNSINPGDSIITTPTLRVIIE
jgi:hypothetical protein